MSRFRTAVPLAAGGTAQVFKAFDSDLDRWVALKLLRHDDPLHVERLLLEARAQARVDHPHVCKIYDVGERDGRPFIAMQYIEGETLGEAAPNLTLEEKVRLVAQVADGVHAAHRVGLIHRDLKPGNVMVERDDDGELRPFVVDFGLAQDEISPRGLTVTGQVVGTAAYMAPEQARGSGRQADRRTDVWALGATLYELLLGRPPFDGNSISEMLIGILQKEPRPPRSFDPHFPRDLQTIVLKCLEKPPERRYVSARALANDLRRFLDGDVIEARPPTLAYRMQTLGRKNPLLLTVSAAALVAFLLGGIKYTFDLRAERNHAIAAQQAAEQAKQEAVQAGQETEEVVEFLVELFEVTNPRLSSDVDVSARELLDRGAARIQRELGAQPLLQARLMDTIGVTYQLLGLSEPALEHLTRAYELRRRELGEVHRQVAASLNHLAYAHLARGELDLAETRFERSAEIFTATFGPETAEVASSLEGLARVYVRRDRYSDARRLSEQVLALKRNALGPDHPSVGDSLSTLAEIDRIAGRLDSAEQGYRQAYELRRNYYGDDHFEVARSLTEIGRVLRSRLRYREAEEAYEQALAVQLRIAGPGSPFVISTLQFLGFLRKKQGDLEAAAETYRRVLDLQEQLDMPEPVAMATALESLGDIYRLQGKLDRAEPLLRQALALHETAGGSDSTAVAWSLHALGELDRERDRLEAATASQLRALEIFETLVGLQHRWTTWPLHSLGQLARAAGRPTEAEAYLRRALEVREATLDPKSPELAATRAELESLLDASAVGHQGP